MSDDFVTIEQYQFLPEAQAVRMHIESEGIEALLADAETVSTEWALGNAVGYIKLQVRKSETDRAQEILNEIRAARAARGDGNSADFETGSCLACGGKLQLNQSSCPECGWSFEAEDGHDTEEVRYQNSANEVTNSSEVRQESVMDSLRSLKPMFMYLMLLPFIVGVFVAAFFMLQVLLKPFVAS